MAEGRRFCENCANAVGETTNFCPSCGAEQKLSSNVPTGPAHETTPPPGSITTPGVNVPTQPPQGNPSQRGGCLRNIIIALVILLLIVVAAGTCTGGGGDDTSDSPAEQAEQDQGAEQQQEAAPEPEPEPEAKPAPASIGETVEVGSVAWQVTNAVPATQLTSDFMDPKQGNFVIVDFLFTNNSEEAVTLDSASLALLDADGRTFEPDTDTFGYIPADKDVFLNQVNPGVTDDGQVIFTVAPGATDFTLEVGDAAFFSDENARIDLGF